MHYQLPERYRLDDDPILGEGGMGRVLRARDVVLDMPVALKIVRPDLASDERFRKLFDLEVRISARFTHPHIVPLHDLGELGDGTPYLGLALADAGSFGRLRQGGSHWGEVLRLTIELLTALAHLHARGVLHRDLKPENVLLWTGPDNQPHVWLADLGLANASASLARKKGRVEGTPGFMAPEQRLGRPREYGPWTDLYALGVMLWELITGALPFPEGESALDGALQPLLPRDGLHVPEGLEVVLANCLAAEPLSRYDLASDLITELCALPELGGGLALATAAGTVAPSAPPPVPTTGIRESGTEVLAEPGSFDPDTVPDWHRPTPPPMPEQIPAEAGFGATARASLQLFAMRELPLVARDDARQALWEQARQVAQDGVSRVVVVVGEAGSGKTHLVDSVVRTLQEHGWAEGVHLGYQESPGKEDGYAGAARALIKPWNETRESLIGRLQRRLGRAWGALDDTIYSEADKLARWCGLHAEDEEPIAAGYGLREVYRFLDARSWRGLATLVIDDAQWAVEDGDGLAIAEAALQAASDGAHTRLLVLATLRAEDLAKDPQLNVRLAALCEAGAVRLDLPRLDRQGTAALLTESLTLAPALASKVIARCEGNPLFARQLLIAWADRGWLVDTGGLQFGLAQGVDADAVLPADAEALFQSRVEALAEASGNPRRFRDALHMAALSGVVMPKDLLASLAGNDEGLQSFMRGCGLWVELGDLAKFDHGLLHQSVRGHAASRRDVSYLHRRLAKLWAHYAEASGTQADVEVGRHAHAGRYWSFGLPPLLRAARRAWRGGRTQELDEAARLAVACCQADDTLHDHQPWAVLWYARAAEAQGDRKHAATRYGQARELFAACDDEEGLLDALVGLGTARREGGEFSEAEQLFGDAMSRARALKDLRREADAIAGMAWLEQQKRNFHGADILFTRVLNRYTELDDATGMAEAALGQAFVARRTGAFDDAIELYDEAADSFSSAGDILGVSRAHWGQAVVRRQQRDLDAAEGLLREALNIAEDLGATELLMECRVGLADIYRARGEAERAAQIYQDHLKWAARTGALESAIFANLGLALMGLDAHDAQQAYERANAVAAQLNKVPGHWLWASYRLVVAALLAQRRDQDQTYRWLWSASELGLADTVDADNAALLTTIADIAAEEGWTNTRRVAAKLGAEQLARLGQLEQARRLRGLSRAG